MTRFSCPDWEARLIDGRPLVPDLILDQALAARAVGIYNKLQLPDVVGQPTLAEAGADWFRAVVGAVCGSFNEDGERGLPEVFLQVPKKNSKTTNVAALTLTLDILNQRPNADLMLLGATQEIANTGFEQLTGMIAADREGYLQQRFHVKRHRSEVVDRLTKATISIKTFDMDVVTGKKPIVVIIDEVHLLGRKEYAARVLRQLRGGMLPFPESFLMMITTQSDLPPAGIYKQELQAARAIRDGKGPENPRTLPVIYEFPERMQTDPAQPWKEPKNWPMVLPNLGRSITIERLVDDFRQEEPKGEDAIRLWASQHLNVEIGLALHSDRWRGADYWQSCAVEGLTLDALLERAEVAVLTADGGGLDDLFGLCIAGRCRITRRWLYWFHAYADATVLELRKEVAPALRDFQESGDLTIAGTTEEIIESVVEYARRIREARLFPKEGGIGLDAHGIGALVDALDEAGFEQPLITAVAPQGFKIQSAVFSMERKLKDKTVEHGGQPLMDFCVGNAKAELRGSSVLITKQAAGKAKIDPLIAGLMATKLLEANPAAHYTELKILHAGKKNEKHRRIFNVYG